tara:strand:+ start:2450 stop:3334 length:885 start_codon:yes stop_codon:yes gene_type:complete
MKVLLLGSTGMAGSALKKSLKDRGVSVIGIARTNSDYDCDLSKESNLNHILNMFNYDSIINSAALVDVDYCEKNSLESWIINSKLVSILASWSSKKKIPFLQISTDHFYDYGDNSSHKEEDKICCVNEYSRHKYAAEAFALTSKNSLILRTSLLGSRVSKENIGLVEWAISNLSKNKKIKLFKDAWTSSIDVDTFADIALRLLLDKKSYGILNVAASEVYSKEQLIRSLADKLSLNHSQCESVSIKSYFSNRPNCLGLDVSKVETILDLKMPSMNDVCLSLISQLKLDSTANSL